MESKYEPEEKYDTIFDICDPKKTFFDPSFCFSIQVYFTHLKSEVSVFVPKLWPCGESNAIYEIANPQNPISIVRSIFKSESISTVLKGEISILRLGGKYNAIFEIKDPRNSYADLAFLIIFPFKMFEFIFWWGEGRTFFRFKRNYSKN